MPALQNFHFNLDRLPFAFAALGEPGGKTLGKALRSQAKTGFQAAIGKGQCVVEVSRVGEVPHRELIKPFERTSAAFAADQNINLKFLGVHRGMIAPEGRRSWLTGC